MNSTREFLSTNASQEQNELFRKVRRSLENAEVEWIRKRSGNVQGNHKRKHAPQTEERRTRLHDAKISLLEALFSQVPEMGQMILDWLVDSPIDFKNLADASPILLEAAGGYSDVSSSLLMLRDLSRKGMYPFHGKSILQINHLVVRIHQEWFRALKDEHLVEQNIVPLLDQRFDQLTRITNTSLDDWFLRSLINDVTTGRRYAALLKPNADDLLVECHVLLIPLDESDDGPFQDQVHLSLPWDGIAAYAIHNNLLRLLHITETRLEDNVSISIAFGFVVFNGSRYTYSSPVRQVVERQWQSGLIRQFSNGPILGCFFAESYQDIAFYQVDIEVRVIIVNTDMRDVEPFMMNFRMPNGFSISERPSVLTGIKGFNYVIMAECAEYLDIDGAFIWLFGERVDGSKVEKKLMIQCDPKKLHIIAESMCASRNPFEEKATFVLLGLRSSEEELKFVRMVFRNDGTDKLIETGDFETPHEVDLSEVPVLQKGFRSPKNYYVTSSFPVYFVATNVDIAEGQEITEDIMQQGMLIFPSLRTSFHVESQISVHPTCMIGFKLGYVPLGEKQVERTVAGYYIVSPPRYLLGKKPMIRTITFEPN